MDIFNQDSTLHQLFIDGLTARQVPKDADGKYIKGGLMSMRPQTMRLMKLRVENFRAFRGETTFDFNGRNVLIYGENGSGKTSVWSAINLFLNAALAKDEKISRANFSKHRHKFNRKPGRVELEVLTETGNYLRDAVWSRDESPYQHLDIAPSARVSARLDYRALWKTYFLHSNKNHVNIWSLLIEELIPNLTTISGPTLEEMWLQIKETAADKDANYWTADDLRKVFHSELENILEEIKSRANQILKVLSPGLEFDFNYWGSSWSNLITRREKRRTKINPPKVNLSISLNGQVLTNHHNLLNEARLSALALSIYLAAAKINAAQARSGFKILALDDVLIGLDMSNRMPVLDILEHWFRDWQIFLFTYDRSWYELAKSRLDKDKWKKFEFFASDDVPVWNEDLDNLNKAEFYLKTARDLAGLSEPVRATPDYRAAGVYARTAFEMALKRFFHKHEVPVVYQLEPKHMLGDLWPVMEKLHSTVGEERGPVLSAPLCRDIETYTKNSLNPLCHSGFFQYDRREVLGAVAAVGQLQNELAKAHKKVGVPAVSATPVVEFDVKSLNESQLGKVLGEIRKELETRNRAKGV